MLAEIIPPAAYILSDIVLKTLEIINTVSATDTVSFRSFRSVVTSITISRIALGGNSDSEVDILHTGTVTTDHRGMVSLEDF